MLRLAAGVAALASVALAEVEASTSGAAPVLALPLRSLASPDDHHPRRRRRLSATPAYPLSGSARDQGVFTVPLALGTPPQILNAIVDTGSTLTAFTCAGCAAGECGTDHGVFDPDASTTAVRLTCTDPACECGAPACTCTADQECAYRRTYAESSSTMGVLVTDGLLLPPGLLNSTSTTPTTARLAFGCALKETGSIHAQPAAGIAGLGADGVGLVDQLAAAGVLTGPAFSLCLAPPAAADGAGPGSGVLLLGPGLPEGVRNDAVISTPLLRGGEASFYTIGLEEVALGEGGSAAPLETTPPQPGVWAGGMGVVLDSGTTYSYLPTPAFTAFRNAVDAAATRLGGRRVKGPDPAFPDDVCWDGGLDGGGGAVAAWAGADFPSLTLTLSPASPSAPPQTLTLPPRNYLFPHPAKPRAAVCLGVFDNGASSGTILGGITFLDTLVQLDRSGSDGAGVARFYRGVDCAGLGKAAEAGMRAATGAAAGAPAAGAPASSAVKRRWVEVLIAGGVLVALASALGLLLAFRRRSDAPPDVIAGAPPADAAGDARWWKWPNFGGAAPALPARWWWMPDYSSRSASAPGGGRGGGPASGRQWEALEGEGYADMALGLAAPVRSGGGGGGGIVVTPADEVEMGRVAK